MKNSVVADGLSNCDFFTGMRPEDLVTIASMCTTKDYEAGAHVFEQGQEGKRLYVICEGQVCLERARDLGDRTGTVSLGWLGRGRAFGGWGRLLGEEHTLRSSAICQKPTKLVVLDGASLREAMLADQTFGFAVLERLCLLIRGRLDDVISAMENLS